MPEFKYIKVLENSTQTFYHVELDSEILGVVYKSHADDFWRGIHDGEVVPNGLQTTRYKSAQALSIYVNGLHPQNR